jgi:ribosomal protein S18 acetylase RimI-like enzyme
MSSRALVMQICAATPDDLPAAVDCLVAAFSDDPLSEVFFGDSPRGRDRATGQFFALVLQARLALNMPLLVARADSAVVGVVMGDDTAPPEWPADLQQRLRDVQRDHPALEAQFATYDRIVEAAGLTLPHYHLGMLGVSPGSQGLGIGKALILAFLDLSDGDPLSTGTSLETAAPANLGLYGHFGFQTRHSGPLDKAQLWCMFRGKPAAAT